jgi:hypothetical protein
MALTDLIESGVNIAFNAIGDLTTSLVLKRNIMERDRNTLRAYVNESQDTFYGTILNYKPREIDGVAVLKTDKKLLAKGETYGATVVPLDPSYEDYIYFENKDHRIINIKAIPGKKLYIIQVREK